MDPVAPTVVMKAGTHREFCLICDRRLSWLRRWLGIQICFRRECRIQIDEAQS